MLRTCLHPLAALLLGASIASPCTAASFTFPGTNTGAIPDNSASGRTLSFNASGVGRPLARVAVSLTLSHTYIGDLEATLISPDGVARLVLFSAVGTGLGTSFGDSSNLVGTYVFRDGGGSLWDAAALVGDAGSIAPGNYFASSRGSRGLANAGGCPTSLAGVFSGLQGAQVNGQWTLVIADRTTGDTGSVSAASLILDEEDIFGNGFEGGATAMAQGKGGIASRCINKPQADFDGDGLSDFVLVRNVGGTLNWQIRRNLGNGTADANPVSFNHGQNFDRIDAMDIDGDRIADPAVWNETTGEWRIRLSSRNGAVRTISHGQTGDDVLQAGDYDGDGIDDLAAFRSQPPGAPLGPLSLLVRSSRFGRVLTVQLGLGTFGDQFVIGGFDYSGDGLADVAMQRRIAGNSAGFQIQDGRSGALLANFTFGLITDLVIPGNHVGSSETDITLGRTSSGNQLWETRDSATGTVSALVSFGVTNDVRISGDYDGDGLSDYASWRPSATPDQSRFRIRSSINPATVFEIPMGQSSDFPVAASRVH